ncbi:MAG: hypothetical protein N3F66_10460 [Spirochaetes bacterium]|nr:hypothetical protein [Spirochaetota bacterium]
MKYIKIISRIILILLILFVIGEIVTYIYVEAPLSTDFYGSITKELVQKRQAQFKVKSISGNNWIHLGWIADPEKEEYIIQIKQKDSWQNLGTTQFGSFLYRGGGIFRVVKVNKKTMEQSVLGFAEVFPQRKPITIYRPVITDNYRPIFTPHIHGYYVNDHTIFQDAAFNWRLVGITSKTDGDPNAEKYFAVGKSTAFPALMQEDKPVADVGDLAWAPHVIKHNTLYHMFWSPHKLHHATSKDGITWNYHGVIMKAPYNKFFRDCMIVQVASDQWLLYTTARGKFFSQIDVYQSFNLTEWQYIRTALASTWGSERNSPFASMESPFVVQYNDGYFLSFTYNNDTLFIHGLLLLFKVWLNKESYNDTLVLYSDNPYDFGVYRGKTRTHNIVAQLKAHAPEWVYVPTTRQWYITTCGWKWVATLTHGQVAVAPVSWEKIK